jgi:hypothetical protein
MRYLFGDSTPFPLPFDFLRTLEAFMAAGTHVVLQEHQVQALAAEIAAAQKERADGLVALTGFHDTLLQWFSGALLPQHPFAFEYAQRLGEQAVGFLKDRHRRVQEADEADATRLRAERARANDEISRHLCTFFQTGRLPTLSTWVGSTLVDGRPEARASLIHPEGIGVSFTLSTAQAPSWSAPRKMADLVGHFEPLVGIKKSWIGSKVSREPVRLDEWVVGSTDLGENAAIIALRKKPDQKDTLVFKVRRDATGFAADVEHPGDPNAGLVPTAADPADSPHLERLWRVLRAMFDEILEERAAITAVTLDGEEAIANGRGQDLVARILTILAPTALEVARRSPNAGEFSLKREGNEGRREELYLRRDTLRAMLDPLPAQGRQVFAALRLEDPPTVIWSRPPPLPPLIAIEGRDELTSRDFEDG